MAKTGSLDNHLPFWDQAHLPKQRAACPVPQATAGEGATLPTEVCLGPLIGRGLRGPPRREEASCLVLTAAPLYAQDLLAVFRLLTSQAVEVTAGASAQKPYRESGLSRPEFLQRVLDLHTTNVWGWVIPRHGAALRITGYLVASLTSTP